MRLYFICACMSVWLLTSCKKVLDTTPQGVIVDNNFWTTSDNLQLYANNFYTSLYVADAHADDVSDNCVNNSPNSWLYGNVTVPNTGGGWSFSDWTNIRNANYFLTHYQTVTGIAADIAQYVGEIRFFRANEYFSKVRTFGDVPWINKDLNVSDSSFLYRSRDPQQLVIDSIIADLQFAAANCKLPASLDAGRIHKYAAMQLLARVALYQGTYMKYRSLSGWESYLTLAANTADQIISSGQYDIVRPVPNIYFKAGDLVDATTGTHAAMDYPLYYKELFIQEDLTTNKECVLPKIYKTGLLQHGLSRTVDESTVGVSKDFIEDYLCVDGLPIGKSGLYKGDDSVILEMSDRDPRFRNTMANRFLPYYLDNSNTPLSHFYTLVNSNCNTGYMAEKFRSPIPGQNEANQSTYDMFVFRYAEVLLISAEAKTELGTISQTDLDNTVNKLRARLDEASLPGGMMTRLSLNPAADPTATTIAGQPRYGYTIAPLLYEIRRERRMELAFEGFRWDDIVRWKAGRLLENPKTVYGLNVNNAVRSQYNGYFGYDVFQGSSTVTINDWDGKTKQLVNPYPGTALRTWNDKLYHKPLPLDQINLSQGKLKQNAGW